ncbi:alpha/beta hydrolase [Paenibacillus sp.]|uniref:alpha/beta fold hydrolase n=1 Tax=Paenibacillus sp. TaxID=58172 RepID=UPI002D455698|nr:alpha/beta hydrolase [Paenibacillus sp.]HZG87858.1 alpha/beta hydrolase [Paenibacillus sp.]
MDRRTSRSGFAYASYGPEDGPPLLLLHGIPGSSHAWEEAGALLGEAGFRVVAPDLLGFGGSDEPSADGYMEEQARGLHALLEELGMREPYVGAHDFGGPVALTLLRLIPSVRLRGLMLSATNTFTDTPIPLPLRSAKVPVLGRIVFRAMAGSRFGGRMMYAQAFRNKSAASRERFERHLTPRGLRRTSWIFRTSLADLPRHYAAVEAQLGRLDCRTLILWGDRDPFFAVDVARRMQRAIPDAELVVLEDTGHFVPEERPALVVEELLRRFDPKGESR